MENRYPTSDAGGKRTNFRVGEPTGGEVSSLGEAKDWLDYSGHRPTSGYSATGNTTYSGGYPEADLHLADGGSPGWGTSEDGGIE